MIKPRLSACLGLAAFLRCRASADPAQTIVRVRTVDGSILRVEIPSDGETSTLSAVLDSAGLDYDESNGLKCQIGLPGRPGSCNLDLSNGDHREKTVGELGLTHGSMITITRPTKKSIVKPKDEKKTNESERFDPFPDLSKSSSYTAASRRARAMARGARGSSYGDISRVRGQMHVIEPQSTGPLTRVYVCQVGAARFQNHCIQKKAPPAKPSSKSRKQKEPLPEVENRVALLFGTINSERVDQNRKRARTSLTSTTEEEKMCGVAKVHALFELPNQKPLLKGKHYDDECLLKAYCDVPKGKKESAVDRAVRVADWLGLRPIGWMFSYADEDRHDDGDALPVHGRDSIVGAKLQIETMKRLGRREGKKFITLALDGRMGATEAFQLSDVCVQMVAEGALKAPIVDESLQGTRSMELTDPVVISGEETTKLDTVLLLVNTAMLSHVGLYSGGEDAPVGGSVKKSSGALLVKTRKRLLSALDRSNSVLKELCDFDVLLALDGMMSREDSEQLCLLVRKYARGQKKGTNLTPHLKLTLRSLLDN